MGMKIEPAKRLECVSEYYFSRKLKEVAKMKLKKCKRILAAGNTYGNFVAFFNHIIIFHTAPHQAHQFLHCSDSSRFFMKIDCEGAKWILVHKETKVMYAMSQYNEFTILLDADGKPLLWEG